MFNRIHICSASNQQLRDIGRTAVSREVKCAETSMICHIWRCSHVEKKLSDIRALTLDRGEHCMRVA